jgi:hypothetical protein
LALGALGRLQLAADKGLAHVNGEFLVHGLPFLKLGKRDAQSSSLIRWPGRSNPPNADRGWTSGAIRRTVSTMIMLKGNPA